MGGIFPSYKMILSSYGRINFHLIRGIFLFPWEAYVHLMLKDFFYSMGRIFSSYGKEIFILWEEYFHIMYGGTFSVQCEEYYLQYVQYGGTCYFKVRSIFTLCMEEQFCPSM